MKKFLPLVLVVIVFIGAGFYIRTKQSVLQPSGTSGGGSPLSDAVSGIGEKIGIVSSIKDAIGLGKRMKCTYSAPDDTGKMGSSTIVVDGEKYKFIAEANGEKSYGVFDGDMQYMWEGKTKQGIKMSKACTDELEKLSGTNNAVSAPETPQSFEESFDGGQGVKCEPTSEDFSVPTDVKFVDQCTILQETMKSLGGLKNQIPAGTNIPGY